MLISFYFNKSWKNLTIFHFFSTICSKRLFFTANITKVDKNSTIYHFCSTICIKNLFFAIIIKVKKISSIYNKSLINVNFLQL